MYVACAVQLFVSTVIAVVTGIRKNAYKKSEYRVSSFHIPDMWLRLKRNEKKHGVPFWPVRKVIHLEHHKPQL